MDPVLQTPPAETTPPPAPPVVPPEKKTSKKMIIAAAILIAVLLILGIGGYFLNARYQASLQPIITPESSPSPALISSPPETTSLVENPPEVILLARSNLADKIGTRDAKDIQITAIEKASWVDSSLGCPEEGEAYAQVITPGYTVTFSHLETEYEYHTDEKQNFVLCSP